VGSETRQVFDIDISCVKTEYQAEVLENAQGQCFVAQLPEGVTKAVQYGTQIKAHAVYLSLHRHQTAHLERQNGGVLNEAKPETYWND
jgi:transposase